MKKIIILILFSLLFTQIQKDSVNKVPNVDFSKGFNIPGIIPEKIPYMAHEVFLFPEEIEAIKQKAKSFIPSSVTKNDVVVLETNRGIMKLKLFPEIAPKHCLNFKKLAYSGFYDGTAFHRIIP